MTQEPIADEPLDLEGSAAAEPGDGPAEDVLDAAEPLSEPAEPEPLDETTLALRKLGMTRGPKTPAEMRAIHNEIDRMRVGRAHVPMAAEADDRAPIVRETNPKSGKRRG